MKKLYIDGVYSTGPSSYQRVRIDLADDNGRVKFTVEASKGDLLDLIAACAASTKEKE